MIRPRCLVLMSLFAGNLCWAQDAAPPTTGVRRALIICGMPGDAEHRKLYSDSITLLHKGLTENQGFSAEHVHVLWGEEATEKVAPVLRSSRGIAGRETIEQA